MNVSLVKVCGVTNSADAAMAVGAGADYVGVILAGGPRHQSVEGAGDIHAAVRGAKRVAVFADQPIEEIARIADMLALDVVQLHGDPDIRQIQRLRAVTSRDIWPVVRVENATLPPEAEALGRVAGWVVLDAKVPGQLGGTGVSLDWHQLASAVQQLRDRNPGMRVVLAGGLKPSNVKTAIELLQPDVVDVSSGVELTVGIKDADAVREFIEAAHAAARQGEG